MVNGVMPNPTFANKQCNNQYFQLPPLRSNSHAEQDCAAEHSAKRIRLPKDCPNFDNADTCNPNLSFGRFGQPGTTIFHASLVQRSGACSKPNEHLNCNTSQSTALQRTCKLLSTTPFPTTTSSRHDCYGVPLKHQSQLPLADNRSELNGENPETQIVCYGVLHGLDHVWLPEGTPYPMHAQWKGGTICYVLGSSIQLSNRVARILDSLLGQARTIFECSFTKVEDGQTSFSFRRTKRCPASCKFALAVIIYGPKHIANDIGDWLSSMRLHLQTPSFCGLDVPYCNPHKLTGISAVPIMTNQLKRRNEVVQGSSWRDENMIPKLYTARSFEKASQPALLKTKLHSHQREALTFMQHRECGWDLQDERHTQDLWQCTTDSFGRKKYLELLTGESSFRAPHTFCGGFLADEMGLGKTCSMLALIASDATSSSALKVPEREERRMTKLSTLIIVPLPLLQVWEMQINQHIHPGVISFITYYGPQKSIHKSFDNIDIVLTTYETVSREERIAKSQSASCKPISDKHWHRIVLDEAHIIKNKDTDITKAVTALSADRRWCITGTPIQNRSSELFALLRFLKVYPYDDFQKFDRVFLKPWKSAEAEGLLKLQQLMSTLAIRRPRKIVSLPPKEDVIIPVRLDPQERLIYEQIKQGFVEIIDAAFGTGESANSYYLNAMQRINDLRLVCNHGIAPARRYASKRSSAAKRSAAVQQELDLLFGTEDLEICTSCGCPLMAGYQHSSVPTVPAINSQHGSYCACVISPSALSADCTPTITLLPPIEKPTSDFDSTIPYISSKVRALVDEIERIPAVDKCAVFSFWTTTLSVISHALTARSIPHTRYDGNMSRSRRDSVLSDFSSDAAANTKVILVSISCGGQGLDLTAANHAYIVEPQWNPMSEEQALSRVFRLGQRKPVRLCRLVTEGTWEQRIVDLQERKKKLAELIVDRAGFVKDLNNIESHPGEENSGDDARKLLRWLRDLVC